MKKLLSFLLAFVMLLSLAPMALAEEEPAEELTEETFAAEASVEADEPAMDMVSDKVPMPTGWWDASGGSPVIEWMTVEGALAYRVTGWYSIDGLISPTAVFHDLVYPDKGYAYCLEKSNYAYHIVKASGDTVSLEAFHSFANFDNLLSNSEIIRFWFTLEAVNAVDDGVMSTATPISDIYMSEKVRGLDLSNSYTSDGRQIIVSFQTKYGADPAAQCLDRDGSSRAAKPADPVDPNGEHVFLYWATIILEWNGQSITSRYSEYDFNRLVTEDLYLYAVWDDPEPEDVPNTYELDLSGAQVSGSEVTGTGKMIQTGGNQPVGKRYAYIVVSYERKDGSTWAVAGTYAVDSDGEFDLPSITGVSDAVSGVLVIGLDAKVGANWAGHNITKPGRIKP